jgi:hypothetical protein
VLLEHPKEIGFSSALVFCHSTLKSFSVLGMLLNHLQQLAFSYATGFSHRLLKPFILLGMLLNHLQQLASSYATVFSHRLFNLSSVLEMFLQYPQLFSHAIVHYSSSCIVNTCQTKFAVNITYHLHEPRDWLSNLISPQFELHLSPNFPSLR